MCPTCACNIPEHFNTTNIHHYGSALCNNLILETDYLNEDIRESNQTRTMTAMSASHKNIST